MPEEKIQSLLQNQGWNDEEIQEGIKHAKNLNNKEPSPLPEFKIDSEKQKSADKTQEETNSEEKEPTDKTQEESENEKKDSEEVSREDNKFSSEDFKELEQEENKKSLLGRLFSKEDNKDNTQQEEKEEYYDELSPKQLSKKVGHIESEIEDYKVEEGKIEGKIEALNEKFNGTNQQLQEALEKIGELRSTVLGRERMYNKLEEDFSQIKYIVNAFKPGTLDKRFDELEATMMKQDSRLEKMQNKSHIIEDKLNEYLHMMTAIKDYETVIQQLKKIKEVEDGIRKERLEVQKASSKTEILFHNIEDSVGKINSAADQSKDNSEQIKELLLSINKLETKSDLLIKKEQVEPLKEDIRIIKKHIFEKEFSKKHKE
jgi:chromosome segregation ATPase